MQLKLRKKGAVMIEYLVVLPAFVLLLWTISQVMLFTLASSTSHESAMEGARVLTMQTRGYEGKLDTLSNKEEVLDKMHEKMATVSEFNKFILLYLDEDGNSVTPIEVDTDTADCTTNVCTVVENPTLCESLLKDKTKKRVVCVYTTVNEVAGKRDHQQIAVKLKSNFRVVGSFIPDLQESIFIHASGISSKELAGRFQPYYNSGG